jgi:saccharopine dehydrogenase-like NADP-dependent oxidoreductase
MNPENFVLLTNSTQDVIINKSILPGTSSLLIGVSSMEILVLGIGMQGKAALFDLVQSPSVTRVVAADANYSDLERFVNGLGSKKVSAVHLDANDHNQVRKLMKSVQAVIVLLPTAFRLPVVKLALENQIHLVDASYPIPEYRELAHVAKANGIAILPECGLDPGIDLIIAGKATQDFETIDEYRTYGAGVPDTAASDNPLEYKISWTFAGVLASYSRPARLIRDGVQVEISARDVFSPDQVHHVEVEGLGTLEAYPNGDVVPYVDMLEKMENIRHAGRYSMRWPGHSAFWKKLINLGFLESKPVRVGDTMVSPRQFMHDILSPQLQYRAGERDVAIVLVDVRGVKDGVDKRVVYQVVDYRDLGTGFLAMQRTVGFTASICAQMILRGDVRGRGLLSPLRDVPAQIFFSELEKRGIHLKHTERAG